MIFTINEVLDKTKVGSKAESLSLLKKQGFSVPTAFVLSNVFFQTVMTFNDSKNKIGEILSSHDFSTKEKSEQIMILMKDFSLPDSLLERLKLQIGEETKYAVRSSSTKEDLSDFSFAGQYDTFLNQQGLANISKAIISCYQSLYSDIVLRYLDDNGFEYSDLEMAVIIQEMVDSEKSGVAFSINPATGADKEIFIEVAEGLGDDLVSGHINPQQYRYDWYNDLIISKPEEGLLSNNELGELVSAVKKIKLFLGFPCDIEFAFFKGTLHLLQSRAVTKISYSSFKDVWSTADFKDGGVSATICTPFMWSLYEFVWETSFKKFLVGTHLIPQKNMRKLGDMFFARPYWNLNVVKEAMAKVPGYKEIDFDSDFGVPPNYEGEGDVTRLSLSNLFPIIRIVLAQSKLVKETTKNAERNKAELLKTYNKYEHDLTLSYSLDELQLKVKQLIQKDYLHSESVYFTQIFINTVHQALFKDTIKKYTDDIGYLALIGGLDNISHLLPFYFLWYLSRSIRANVAYYAHWVETSQEVLLKEYNEGVSENLLYKLKEYSERFGYHSEKELDITYPCYEEDMHTIIGELKQLVLLDDSYSPKLDRIKQQKAYNDQLDSLKEKTGNRKFNKRKAMIEKMRSLLWWREEFRDISTRYYCLIRNYVLKLAYEYEKSGIIDNAEDIWFLKIENLWDFIDEVIDISELQKIIDKNRNYYNSYRNYQSENEIGFASKLIKKVTGDSLSGLVANVGNVTGTVRVVESLEETNCIEKGDILVTRFTDTGWTSKFVLLSGIVTEYGGVLCHAAIVSREYGIPCVVCVENATKRIKNGSTITINGSTGEIIIHGKS